MRALTMRVFNGQTADGLECSASLVMRKRGRWVLVVAIGTMRNGLGAVMLPSGVQPYEIPMGAPGERRPSDKAIGRAVLECIEADAETRRTNQLPVRGRTNGKRKTAGLAGGDSAGKGHEKGNPPGASLESYGIESGPGHPGDEH